MLEVLETCWEVYIKEFSPEVGVWLDSLTSQKRSEIILKALRFYYQLPSTAAFEIEHLPNEIIRVRFTGDEMPEEFVKLTIDKFQENLEWSLRNTLQGIWRDQIREC